MLLFCSRAVAPAAGAQQQAGKVLSEGEGGEEGRAWEERGQGSEAEY